MDKSKRCFSDNISTESRHKSKQQKPQHRRSISFGDDISTEILLRLPVKSVLQFKSVSKQWLSIVSSTQFRQSHASRHSRTAIGLFFPIDRYNFHARLLINSQIKPEIKLTVPQLNLPKDYEFTNLTCVSSCNGLQLFKSPKWNSPEHMYHVYNPATQESKALPDIPPHIRNNIFVCASLAFDPYESLNYKVIFLYRQPPLSDNYQIVVYSSTTGTCKALVSNIIVEDFWYDDKDEGFCTGIFCNGAIHWQSGDANSIVYFNVHTEFIKLFEIPLLASDIQYFGESRGHLYLVNSDQNYFNDNSVLDVYELKSDYSGWFLKYQVDLDSVKSTLPRQVYREDYGTYMSVFREEEEDDSTMVLFTCNEWVEYNFKKKTTKRLCEFVMPKLCNFHFPWSYGFNTHQFIPTLTCI